MSLTDDQLRLCRLRDQMWAGIRTRRHWLRRIAEKGFDGSTAEKLFVRALVRAVDRELTFRDWILADLTGES